MRFRGKAVLFKLIMTSFKMQELVQRFSFHNYDDLKQAQKMDPCRREKAAADKWVVSLLFGAAKGDLSVIRR